MNDSTLRPCRFEEFTHNRALLRFGRFAGLSGSKERDSPGRCLAIFNLPTRILSSKCAIVKHSEGSPYE